VLIKIIMCKLKPKQSPASIGADNQAQVVHANSYQEGQANTVQEGSEPLSQHGETWTTLISQTKTIEYWIWTVEAYSLKKQACGQKVLQANSQV